MKSDIESVGSLPSIVRTSAMEKVDWVDPSRVGAFVVSHRHALYFSGLMGLLGRLRLAMAWLWHTACAPCVGDQGG
jgi:hypothetical protein